MLIYQSETPRAMKGYCKNQSGLDNTNLFMNWFKTCFCPAIKKFCVDIVVKPRVLLVLDNAPGHPLELPTLCTDFSVEVVFYRQGTNRPDTVSNNSTTKKSICKFKK